jgi:hypothetical protein
VTDPSDVRGYRLVELDDAGTLLDAELFCAHVRWTGSAVTGPDRVSGGRCSRTAHSS